MLFTELLVASSSLSSVRFHIVRMSSVSIITHPGPLFLLYLIGYFTSRGGQLSRYNPHLIISVEKKQIQKKNKLAALSNSPPSTRILQVFQALHTLSFTVVLSLLAPVVTIEKIWFFFLLPTHSFLLVKHVEKYDDKTKSALFLSLLCESLHFTW